MKKVLFSLFIVFAAASCKQEESTNDVVGLDASEVRYKGEYIHVEQMTALLLPNGETYAVQIDDKSAELDEKAKEFKRTPYDMVKVVLTGELIPNPFKKENGEGWDQMLKIEKIVEVSAGEIQSVQRAAATELEEN